MRRSRALLLVVSAALGIALACDVLPIPTDVEAPTNLCVGLNDCERTFPEAGVNALACSSQTCVSQAPVCDPQNPDPTTCLVLVVSLPSTALSIDGPGLTMGFPNWSPTDFGPVPRNCASNCVWLPNLPPSNGQVIVTDAFGRQVYPNGLRPMQPPGDTTLPVSAILHPMWLDPNSKRYILARQLGLPLSDATSTSTLTNFQAPPPTDQGPPVSAVGVSFQILAPGGYRLNDGLGTGMVEVVPVAPFTAFPPIIQNLGGGIPGYQGLTRTWTLDISTGVVARPYTMHRAAGAPSLAGWSAYTLDASGFRVSSIAQLSGTQPQESIMLYDATGTSAQDKQVTLFVPPPGVALPTYVDTPTAGFIDPQPSYPALPDQVVVSGTVLPTLTDGGTASPAAQIVFIADNNDFNGTLKQQASLFSPTLNVIKQLSYRADVTTNDAGQYAVTLPPGLYRYYVIPTDDTLAITRDFTTIGLEPNQNGRGLAVNPRVHVKGRVVLGDGTPVVGATVVLDSSPDGPLDPSTYDPLAAPRRVQGITDASGRFDVLSDTGTIDITVRPLDGTRYPWVVTTNWKVSADLSLPKSIVIPAPFVYSGKLVDNGNNAVFIQTMVRVYGFPQGGADDAGVHAPRGARLLGQTVTQTVSVNDPSTAGQFQLFLAPPSP